MDIFRRPIYGAAFINNCQYIWKFNYKFLPLLFSGNVSDNCTLENLSYEGMSLEAAPGL